MTNKTVSSLWNSDMFFHARSPCKPCFIFSTIFTCIWLTKPENKSTWSPSLPWEQLQYGSLLKPPHKVNESVFSYLNLTCRQYCIVFKSWIYERYQQFIFLRVWRCDFRWWSTACHRASLAPSIQNFKYEWNQINLHLLYLPVILFRQLLKEELVYEIGSDRLLLWSWFFDLMITLRSFLNHPSRENI